MVTLLLLALFFDLVLDPLFDLLTVGIGGGIITNAVATPVFWLLLNHHGVSLFGSAYGTGSFATLIVESLPEINILPMWTWRIAMICIKEGRSGTVY